MSAATNGIAIGVVPEFPTRIAQGATNVAASVNLINGSSGAEATGPLTVTELTLVPSCANFTPTCSGGADSGVFTLSSTGTGATGTGCAGRAFALSVIDSATGRVRITPADGSVLQLGQYDMTTENDTCRINFTVSNLRMPSIDSYTSVSEVQTDQVGYLAVRHANGNTGTDQGEDVTTVVPSSGSPAPTPTTTVAPAPAPTTTTTPTTKPPVTTAPSTTTTTKPPVTTAPTTPPTTKAPSPTTTTTTAPDLLGGLLRVLGGRAK